MFWNILRLNHALFLANSCSKRRSFSDDTVEWSRRTIYKTDNNISVRATSTDWWTNPNIKWLCSFIGMIFTCHPTQLIKAGLHWRFHSSYHHQALYIYTLHLKIRNSRLHARQVCHFYNVDTVIRKVVNEFTWNRTFVNLNVS